MTPETSQFRVESVGHFDLTELPTTVKPLYKSKKNYQKKLKRNVKKLSALQRFLTPPTSGRCW